MEAKNYEGAFKLLKRNPMLAISKDDGVELLNNIAQLNPNDDNFEKNQKQVLESSVYIYRRLERQKILKGFGCIDGEYPEKSTDISPAKLEELTGLSIASLTPRERTTYWRLAGVMLCALEYVFGINIGIDPLFTLIPLTFFLLGVDQLFYKGAAFETVYRTLFPEYGSKIIAHEAGHFLIAYLLGVPVRECVTNAWDARKNPDIKGQAGTIFFDSKLAEEMDKQQVTRTSLNRLSVVIMAGIAAEALKFGRAEGGAVDEQSLIGFLNSIQPPWNILRIQGQARWAVLQAILLIKEHMSSYNALVKALEEKKSVGDCVAAIEDNLPAELPATRRVEAKVASKKVLERESLLRYVQRMTWSVGGIEQEDEEKYAENAATSSEESKENAVVSTAAQVDEDVANFTVKIRMLEDAVRKGKVNADNEIDSPAKSGGIWLNDLSSVKSPGADFEVELASLTIPTVRSSNNSTVPSILRDRLSSDNVTETSVLDLLTTHRGFQIKQLENLRYKKKIEEAEIDGKLVNLQQALEKASAAKALVRK
eukprot:gene26769-35455_t